MSREDCDYVIDRALATGGLDSDGNPTLHVKGTRDEIIGQIMEIAGGWGQPMTRNEATRVVYKAIAKRSWPWLWIWIALGAAIGAFIGARITGVI